MENVRAIEAHFESCCMTDVDVAGMVVDDPHFAKQVTMTRVKMKSQVYQTPMLGESEASEDGDSDVYTSGSPSSRPQSDYAACPEIATDKPTQARK